MRVGGGDKPWRQPDGYDDANTRAGLLHAGSPGAGLSDGSVVGDWRLPTKSELVGITQGTEDVSDLYQRFFTNVSYDRYWSSTTPVDYSDHAWCVSMYDHYAYFHPKFWVYPVWPVRPDN